MGQDKKVKAGRLTFIMVRGIGQAFVTREIEPETVKSFLMQAVEDSYKRLVGPSIETELRLLLKSQAEDEAINVFSKNLESLLLLPPIPGKIVLGVDPGQGA